jgi:hypothetical protein
VGERSRDAGEAKESAKRILLANVVAYPVAYLVSEPERRGLEPIRPKNGIT